MSTLTQRKLARILFDEFHSESWSISRERAREMQPEDPANASYQHAADELARRDFQVVRNIDAALNTDSLRRADMLILNAGIFPIVPFEETTRELWDRTLAINLTGAFLCARRALPAMREAGYGRIVGIGSSAGKAGGARSVAAYAASKAGVMTLMKSIANEYAAHGITANALAPALIDTPMIANTRDLVTRIPVGRFGRVDEVAALVAFLASEHAGYITGEVTDINGGFLID